MVVICNLPKIGSIGSVEQIIKLVCLQHHYLLLAPEYQYRVSLYSPLTAVGTMWHAVFSVSLYHEVFIKASISHFEW